MIEDLLLISLGLSVSLYNVYFCCLFYIMYFLLSSMAEDLPNCGINFHCQRWRGLKSMSATWFFLNQLKLKLVVLCLSVLLVLVNWGGSTTYLEN